MTNSPTGATGMWMPGVDPMKIIDQTAICDGGQHEVNLVTNGRWYYTYKNGMGGSAWPIANLSRNDHDARGACPAPMCEGHLIWNLSDAKWFDTTSDMTIRAMDVEFDWDDMPDLSDTDTLEAWLRE